jgi:YHS domain-containing protein
MISVAVVAMVALSLEACANSDGVAKVNKTPDGLAVRGFDTVAYFVAQNAVQGEGKYEYAWNGAKWLFSSQENMEKFKQNPEAYAPQFGGYCSYAVSRGYTADADPTAWKIVDGKLYLNYNQGAKEAWEEDQEKSIKDGQKNWVEFQKKKPEHKG